MSEGRELTTFHLSDVKSEAFVDVQQRFFLDGEFVDWNLWAMGLPG